MDKQEIKRAHTRVPNEFNVRILVKDTEGKLNGKELKTSKSINVSASGLLIHVNEQLEINTVLSITFMKPNSFDFFRGEGTVVRVSESDDKSYQVAINFINLSDKDKKDLDYYITLK